MKFFIGAGSLSAARAVLAASQVLILPLLARYLTLEDFALVALSMSIVTFTQVLSDAGLGRSLIRTPNYDETEWSSVFWLLCAIGLTLTAVVLAAAPGWAWLFDAPQAIPLIAALSIVPFLQAVGAVPNAEIERREGFPLIAAVTVSCTAAGLAVAVILAIRGAGAWALIGQQIVIALGRCAAICALSRFRPRARFDRSTLSGHVAFARDSVGVSFIYALQTQAPTILIGRIVGVAPLGVFTMAQRFLRLPQFGLAGPVSQVVFVRLASVRDDPARMGAIYLAATRLLALAIIPPMAALAAIGPAFFPLLLSEEWAAVAPVFALAFPGFALDAATSAAGMLFLASGATGLRLRMAAERATLRTMVLAAAAPFGLEAAALSLSIFSVAYLPRYWAYAQRCAPFNWRTAFQAIFWPAAGAALVWITIAVWRSHVAPTPGEELAAGGSGLLATLALTLAPQWRAFRRDLALFRS